jgi:HlyD family secretion protein
VWLCYRLNFPIFPVITELLPLGRFAIWKAERVVSDHDRNTLRMRVEAEGDLAKSEPGMTV